MFRKIVFWLHLCTGVGVGLVVAMMSFTGVLLTYEHQIVSWADAKTWPSPGVGAARKGIEALAASATESGIEARRVTVYRDESLPVLVGGGRRDPSTYVDAFSGKVLGRPTNATRDLMQTLTAWHRWFDAGRDSRATAQLITGASNLAFLFLLVSGAYLWLPKIFRWPLFRQRLKFAKSYRNARDRDFYWHHIFAAWSFVPLIVIIVTAVVISFPWANKLLTGMAGSAPARPIQLTAEDISPGSPRKNLDELMQQAMAQSTSWKSVAIDMPAPDSPTVSFEIDNGSGRQPHKRQTIVLSAYTGEVVGTSGFSDRAPARQAIAWNRYLHTGESFGFVGQTIAGLVSIASLIMVWTGLALAWRRLIVPLYRKR